MPMDGFTLGLIAGELNNTLEGGRIDRIVQPERDELFITIRNGGANHVLLLSASAGCARAHLTNTRKNSPLEPFNLCMLMRKHLMGGRVVSIHTIDCDRILEIEIEHMDELGDRAKKSIICEFMGKHSNLIFVNAEGRIIDSARRVSEAISSVREVLPGLRYECPPPHGKIPYDSVTEDKFYAAVNGQGGALWKVISGNISGMSTQTARELAFRAAGNEDAHIEECDLSAVCASVAQNISAIPENIAPAVLYNEDDRPIDAVAFPYLCRSHVRSERFDTISQAMDAFFRSRDLSERISQKSAAIHRTLKNNIERCEKKLALQREALLGSERMEEYRICGELLMANVHLATKGKTSVMLPNYYDPEMKEIEIKLDVKLSPAQNAQHYFKLYQKARNARTLAAEQIEKTSEELAYLEGQMDNLSKCSGESELAELREELEHFGYVRRNTSRRQMKQLPPSKPMKFTSPSGSVVLVGKNNLQNDKLTFSADLNEVWLHAKDMPGSHVIIVGENPDDETIVFAAKIAAAYSKGGTGSKVPVDYTLRRYVKKPSGSKPGFVIYTNQKTLYVDPEVPKAEENI